MIRAFFPAAALLLTLGCAERPGAYPSLGIRPVEKKGFAEPDTPVAQAAPDPALDSRIADFGKRLDVIARGFAADAAKAEGAAKMARGQPAGSEPWIEAQTALASLDDWRAQLSALASDTEQAGIDRAATLAPPYPALQALNDRIATESTAEAETIRRLQSGLVAA